MNEIKCPNCGEVFTVNESQYAELLSQVRTVEFDKELHERIKQELTLVEQKALNEQQAKLAQKDQEIAQLQSQINNFDTEKELAKKEVEQSASQSLLEKEKEVQALENQLATLRLEHENQLQKNAIRLKISSFYKKKKTNFLLLLLNKTTKPSSRQLVSRLNFTRISRRNNQPRQSVKVWNTMRRVNSTRFEALPFQMPTLKKTTRFQHVVLRAILSSVILMKMD